MALFFQISIFLLLLFVVPKMRSSPLNGTATALLSPHRVFFNVNLVKNRGNFNLGFFVVCLMFSSSGLRPIVLFHVLNRSRILTDPPRCIKRGSFVSILVDLLGAHGESLVPLVVSAQFTHTIDGGNGLAYKILFKPESGLQPLNLVAVLAEPEKGNPTHMKFVERPGISRIIDTRTKCAKQSISITLFIAIQAGGRRSVPACLEDTR